MTTGAKVPVHDLDAERAVLASLMVELSYSHPNDRWADIGPVLKADDFQNSANGRIYEAIGALHATGELVDLVTVASELRKRERLADVGGVAYLSQLNADAAPTPERAIAYANIVARTARQRRLVSVCQRIAAEGYEDVGNIDEWAAKAEADVRAASEGGVTKLSCEPIGEVLKGELTDLEEDWRRGTPPRRVTTGIPELDRRLTMMDGDLIVVGARPGMGKTALIGGASVWMASSGLWPKDLQDAWAEEDPASLVFSQEMPKGQIALRCLCSSARVDLSGLRRGHMEPGDWEKLARKAQDLSSVPLWIDEKPGISTDYVRKTIRSLKRELKRTDLPNALPRTLRLVVIDYLQLMKLTGRKDATKSELVGNVTRTLKEIAKEEKLVIILLSQLNRSVEARENKRPTLADLRDSGEIEQDADAVVFLYRDGYYHKDSKHPDIAEAIIAKQRNGGEARALMRWEGRYTLFSELSESEREQLQHEAEDQAHRPKASKGTRTWI